MILRNSISKAKKLFHNTFQSFKTMLFNGYERLPKTTGTTPFNPFSCAAANSKLHHSFSDLESNNSTGKYRGDPEKKTKKKSTKKEIKTPLSEIKQDPLYNNGSFMKFAHADLVEERERERQQQQQQQQRRKQVQVVRANAGKSRGQSSASSSSFRRRVETSRAITQRLKELELMDLSNVEHLMDIEEIRRYYSRITCPFYVDMVNKFFMEMYGEFLPHQTSPQAGGISRHISNW